MSCLSLPFIEQLVIWIVIIVAIYKIIQLVLPWLTGLIGIPIVGAILSILLWVIVAIAAIKVLFLLLGCLLGAGSLHFL